MHALQSSPLSPPHSVAPTGFSAADLEFLTPPANLNLGVGGGDFHAIGRHFFEIFIREGGLRPDHHVLDVGCGCGRMAVPLLNFLTSPGKYDGFDIVPEAVQWAREHIATRSPLFRFGVADVFNRHYQPAGKSLPDAYRFPYPGKSFDFIFLTSVFTHMLAPELENYLANIVRCLKPNGRCLMSFFLLNDASRQLMAAKKNSIQFPYPLENCAISDDNLPEAAVAYDENFVRRLLAKHGLKIVGAIHPGAWSGRRDFLSYQDVVIVKKTWARRLWGG